MTQYGYNKKTGAQRPQNGYHAPAFSWGRRAPFNYISGHPAPVIQSHYRPVPRRSQGVFLPISAPY